MLRQETHTALASFIFEEILCRWGMIEEIITDNGTAFLAAIEYLKTRYSIPHIPISPYNSRANGIVERRHRDVREALIKAADGDETKWPLVAASVFWAERVTIQKSTGYSPYYIAHGVEPLLPFDLAEATYLARPLGNIVSTTDLIAYRARMLQKRPEDLERVKKALLRSRMASVRQFEKEYRNSIRSFVLNPGSLVLVRNSRIDSTIGAKTKPRYLGPFVVLIKTTGGSFVLAELDGTVSKLRYAAYRVIPYYPRTLSQIPVTKITNMDEDQLEATSHDREPNSEAIDDGYTS
jgi:hypothetical protein